MWVLMWLLVLYSCACVVYFGCFGLSSRRRHTRCALVTGVQTCALPISVVGEQDSLRAAFDDGGGNRTVGDIGEALRREYDRDILLAQHLEPFADTGGEQRIVEEHPGFIEDEQRRASVEPLFKPEI